MRTDPPGDQIVMAPWPGQRLDRLRELLGHQPTPEEVSRHNHLLTAPVPF